MIFMVSMVGLIGLVILVYWCRNWIQKHLQGIVRLLGFSSRSGLGIYTFIFFPGVILHEMSHFFMAALLGVRTGKITLIPEYGEELSDNKGTALGSVEVGKSDVIRGSLIGAAPFILGSLILYVLVNKYFFNFQLIEDSIRIVWKGNLNQPIFLGILLYLIFVIGNTMFSSKEDTHSWPLIVILAITLSLIGYLSGSLSGALEFLLPIMISLANTLLGAMFFVVLVDFSVITGIFISEKVIEKILKKRVRYGR